MVFAVNKIKAHGSSKTSVFAMKKKRSVPLQKTKNYRKYFSLGKIDSVFYGKLTEISMVLWEKG